MIEMVCLWMLLFFAKHGIESNTGRACSRYCQVNAPRSLLSLFEIFGLLGKQAFCQIGIVDEWRLWASRQCPKQPQSMLHALPCGEQQAPGYLSKRTTHSSSLGRTISKSDVAILCAFGFPHRQYFWHEPSSCLHCPGWISLHCAHCGTLVGQALYLPGTRRRHWPYATHGISSSQPETMACIIALQTMLKRRGNFQGRAIQCRDGMFWRAHPGPLAISSGIH